MAAFGSVETPDVAISTVPPSSFLYHSSVCHCDGNIPGLVGRVVRGRIYRVVILELAFPGPRALFIESHCLLATVMHRSFIIRESFSPCFALNAYLRNECAYLTWICFGVPAILFFPLLGSDLGDLLPLDKLIDRFILNNILGTV